MRFVSLLCLFLFPSVTLLAQCMPAKELLNHIRYLRDSSKLSNKQQLADLLPYEARMNGCPYKNDSTHVILLKRIGALYLYDAEYLRAAKYYGQSIDLTNANAGRPSVNAKNVINSYLWLSTIYDSLKDITNKMKAVDSCIKISFRLNFPANLACLFALEKRIEYLYDVGDYRRCADDAAMCEILAGEFIPKAVGAELPRALALASSSFEWRINSLLALKNFDETEQILLNKIVEYKKSGLSNYLGVIYDQLAHLEMHKSNFEKALVYFEQELKYLRIARLDFSCKQTLNSIGNDIYFNHFHDDRRALLYFRDALACINKDEMQEKADIMETLNLYNHIGNVYAHEGKFDSAMYFFQQAFDQVKPGLNEATVLQVPAENFKALRKLNFLSGLLIDKADARWKQYLVSNRVNDIMEAVRIYRVADQLLDRIKREQADIQSKLFWRKETRRLYEHAIAACYQYNNMEEAFYFFEKSRAVLLNDQLNEQHWISGEDIFRRTQLKKKILLLNEALNDSAAPSPNREAWQKDVFDKNHELDILDEHIKEHNPLFYQNFLDTSHITLMDVRRKILVNHQALVELFEGDSAVYVLLVTPNQAHITLIDKIKFDSLSSSYIGLLSSPAQLNRHFDEFVQSAGQLQQLIFPDNLLPSGRIIISPEGRYFPFESLITGGSISKPVYFLNNHSVSYTYSARYLLDDFSSSTLPASSGSLLGIAPMQYASNTGLAALPGSGRSLEKIMNYLPDENSMLSEEASRNNFLRHFTDYAIIQLYTHASDSGEKKEPVIYFADSALYLSELMLEKKPATRLIVLSACETGKGKLYQGEGVFSFNRGFAALGIPSSIANLWSIDNESTYRLTETFYKYLALGMPIDLALQKAKLSFIQEAGGESRLPYFWAAPILVGKTDPIIVTRTEAWKHLFVIFAVVGFFYLAWRISPKQKRVEVVSQPG